MYLQESVSGPSVLKKDGSVFMSTLLFFDQDKALGFENGNGPVAATNNYWLQRIKTFRWKTFTHANDDAVNESQQIHPALAEVDGFLRAVHTSLERFKALPESETKKEVMKDFIEGVRKGLEEICGQFQKFDAGNKASSKNYTSWFLKRVTDSFSIQGTQKNDVFEKLSQALKDFGTGKKDPIVEAAKLQVIDEARETQLKVLQASTVGAHKPSLPQNSSVGILASPASVSLGKKQSQDAREPVHVQLVRSSTSYLDDVKLYELPSSGRPAAPAGISLRALFKDFFDLPQLGGSRTDGASPKNSASTGLVVDGNNVMTGTEAQAVASIRTESSPQSIDENSSTTPPPVAVEVQDDGDFIDMMNAQALKEINPDELRDVMDEAAKFDTAVSKIPPAIDSSSQANTSGSYSVVVNKVETTDSQPPAQKPASVSKPSWLRSTGRAAFAVGLLAFGYLVGSRTNQTNYDRPGITDIFSSLKSGSSANPVAPQAPSVVEKVADTPVEKKISVKDVKLAFDVENNPKTKAFINYFKKSSGSKAYARAFETVAEVFDIHEALTPEEVKLVAESLDSNTTFALEPGDQEIGADKHPMSAAQKQLRLQQIYDKVFMKFLDKGKTMFKDQDVQISRFFESHYNEFVQSGNKSNSRSLNNAFYQAFHAPVMVKNTVEYRIKLKRTENAALNKLLKQTTDTPSFQDALLEALGNLDQPFASKYAAKQALKNALDAVAPKYGCESIIDAFYRQGSLRENLVSDIADDLVKTVQTQQEQ